MLQLTFDSPVCVFPRFAPQQALLNAAQLQLDRDLAPGGHRRVVPRSVSAVLLEESTGEHNAFASHPQHHAPAPATSFPPPASGVPHIDRDSLMRISNGGFSPILLSAAAAATQQQQQHSSPAFGVADVPTSSAVSAVHAGLPPRHVMRSDVYEGPAAGKSLAKRLGLSSSEVRISGFCL